MDKQSGSRSDVPVKVVAFDLGDTLVEYEGLPLSWEAHYPAALASLAGANLTPPQSEAGCAILRRFNTRLHPRTLEVAFHDILRELAPALGLPDSPDELAAARAFFRVFRQRLRCFPEARAVLAALRQRGVRLGVFTDVPYGMPRELVLEDVMASGLTGTFDLLLTSGDVGFRKPAPETLARIAAHFGAAAAEMTYVGNERKDIEAARAFGCTAVLLDRSGARPAWGQHQTVRSLEELLPLVGREAAAHPAETRS